MVLGNDRKIKKLNYIFANTFIKLQKLKSYMKNKFTNNFNNICVMNNFILHRPINKPKRLLLDNKIDMMFYYINVTNETNSR